MMQENMELENTKPENTKLEQEKSEQEKSEQEKSEQEKSEESRIRFVIRIVPNEGRELNLNCKSFDRFQTMFLWNIVEKQRTIKLSFTNYLFKGIVDTNTDKIETEIKHVIHLGSPIEKRRDLYITFTCNPISYDPRGKNLYSSVVYDNIAVRGMMDDIEEHNMKFHPNVNVYPRSKHVHRYSPEREQSEAIQKWFDTPMQDVFKSEDTFITYLQEVTTLVDID